MKLKDHQGAAILGWVLSPLALFNILVLIVIAAHAKGTWYVSVALFAFLYMIPALVIWAFLLILAYGRCGLGFIRMTWGAHVLFNIAASIFWIGVTVVERTAFPTSLYPLAITLPVLIWSACSFKRTFTSDSNQ